MGSSTPREDIPRHGGRPSLPCYTSKSPSVLVKVHQEAFHAPLIVIREADTDLADRIAVVAFIVRIERVEELPRINLLSDPLVLHLLSCFDCIVGMGHDIPDGQLRTPNGSSFRLSFHESFLMLCSAKVQLSSRRNSTTAELRGPGYWVRVCINKRNM